MGLYYSLASMASAELGGKQDPHGDGVSALDFFGLGRLLEDGEERRRLGELGRAAVHKSFSARRMADDFAAVCASLASESGSPRL